MKIEILNRLNDLQIKINSGDYIKEIGSLKEWGGADVVISRRLSPQIRKWAYHDQVDVTNSQSTGPGRRVVITEHSRELSWLFYQLRDNFAGAIDHASKYYFYGSLARAALDYTEANPAPPQCHGLLSAVLNAARNYLRS